MVQKLVTGGSSVATVSSHEEEYVDDDEEMDDGAIPENIRSNDAMLSVERRE